MPRHVSDCSEIYERYLLCCMNVFRHVRAAKCTSAAYLIYHNMFLFPSTVVTVHLSFRRYVLSDMTSAWVGVIAGYPAEQSSFV